MRRAVFIVFFTLIAFDVSGLAAICGDPPCDEDCPADASGGECAPNCHACACCSLPKVTAGGVAAHLVNPPTQRTAWTVVSDQPASPAPADILHVPKLLLA